MTDAQHRALKQLRRIERNAGGDFEVVHVEDKDGRLSVWLSLSCVGFESAPTGLRLRDRERAVVSVSDDFPFRPPSVRVEHTRFAGFPHVQWMHSLCLYAAPAVEWDPSDGMYGFVTRLHEWFRKAALDELDPIGAPLHPPVAYRRDPVNQFVVARADTPAVRDTCWIGLAPLKRVGTDRADVTEWVEFGRDVQLSDVAAALLLARPLTFEYPETIRDLIAALERQGIARNLLFLILQAAAFRNDPGTPLLVMLGTPTRGRRGAVQPVQHLAAWYIDATNAEFLRISLKRYNSLDEIQAIGAAAQQLLDTWADEARIAWCEVLEDRPESTIRRDQESVMASMRGKSVVLWGCGALGSFIAESLVRAGARRLMLRDSGRVKPGLLVRQSFTDLNIGRLKVCALWEHLREIMPGVEVAISAEDILDNPLSREDWTEGADLVIDSTGSEAILARLESVRKTGARRCPVVSMAIDSEAVRGVVVCARPEHTGGPQDLLRAAKIAVGARSDLHEYAKAFWKRETTSLFRPEPGCSDPTFVGSHADVHALASSLLNLSIAEAFRTDQTDTGVVLFTRRAGPGYRDPDCVRLGFEPDVVIPDLHSGFEVRIAASAVRDLRGWIRASARVADREVETGGAILGELDEAVRTVWISEVTGPPPDSEAAAEGFLCGIEGLRDRTREAEQRTDRAVRFLGMWHTHPGGYPVPSPTDLRGMTGLVTEVLPSLPDAVMLIVGGQEPDLTIGAYVFEREEAEIPRSLTRLCAFAPLGHAEVRQPARIGLALSGGGSRAIAFELGCLRALNDVGLLERVSVISSVSGGSVLAAMYAYSGGSFEDFDTAAVALLRRGLNRAIIRELFTTPLGITAAGTAVTAGVVSLLSSGLRRLAPRRYRSMLYAPLRRWRSRTDALERALHRSLFPGTTLPDARRHAVAVIINACELRTGSAFRFGNVESGSWRKGRRSSTDITVSEAVAASAAYPLALPALDREYDLERKGTRTRERVAITDGGVYDNLGISCLLPDRDATISTNVHPVDYIISCDAGHGLLDGTTMPFWFPSRMAQVYLATYQRTLAAARQHLHELAANQSIEGFVLCYLGQDDDRLPWKPGGLVPRSAVNKYPTNFAAMPEHDIELLTKRGEQLMRALVSGYLAQIL